MISDLILVRTNTFIGKKIREITNSYYNHVGMFIDDENIIESKNGVGVIITPFKKFKELKAKNKIDFAIYRFKQPLKLNELKMVGEYLRSQVGKKYDIMQFLSLLIFFIFHVDRNVNPIDIENAFICSELIGKALALINIFFIQEIELDNLTPKDIEDSSIIEKLNLDI